MTKLAGDSAITIHGTTKAGFEPVRECFTRQARLLGTGGAAFAATYRGERVVDLWAGMADHDREWTRNTRVHIQSTSKAVVGFAAACLVDRGELDLDQTVAHYWPEYGCHGKERTLVRHLVSHAAGSARLPGYREWLDLDGNGLDDYEGIASRLAAAEPDWVPGTAHGYHGYTYGNLVGELVFRITGRRVGVWLQDEICGPLGLSLWLGTPLAEQRELAAIKTWPQAPLPELPAEVLAGLAGSAEALKALPFGQPGTWQFESALKGLFGSELAHFSLSVGQLWRQPRALAAEFGSANVTADARSLARLFTPLAMAGELDGRPLLRPETVQAVSARGEPGGVDLVLGREMGWTCGGHHGNNPMIPGLPRTFGPNSQAFGMTGGGGNLASADPVAGIACGFVRNHYDSTFGLSSLLIDAMYGCLGTAGKASGR